MPFRRYNKQDEPIRVFRRRGFLHEVGGRTLSASEVQLRQAWFADCDKRRKPAHHSIGRRDRSDRTYEEFPRLEHNRLP
jgi:hypothetical protein